MEIPANSWGYLALQIPLALLVAVLAVYFVRTIREIIKDFLDQLKEQASLHQSFIANQNELNRKYMETAQIAHNQSTERLAEEIKKMSTDTIKEVAELTRVVDGVLDKAQIMDYVLRERQKEK